PRPRRPSLSPTPTHAPHEQTRAKRGPAPHMPANVTLRHKPQRVYKSHFTGSTKWNEYEPRPGDIVISTPLKTGTTWAQRITAALIFQSDKLPGPLMTVSPWLDCTFAPLPLLLANLEFQEHRRFIKTHLPMDALPIYDEVS